MERVDINSLKLLIKEEFITYKDELFESIKAHGVISPIVVSQNTVCDGHKRIAICKKLGIEDVPVVYTDGKPVELLFELNDREFDINHVATLLLGHNLTDKEISNICKKAGFSNSPQMVFAIKYLTTLLEKSPELYQYQLPANIWRELGHLGKDIDRYASDLLVMQGTVSEKRSIATFLRQAQRRNELPDSIKAEKTVEILPKIQKIAQPRKTEAYEKYEKAVAKIEFPNSLNIRIDPTFEQSGVALSLNVNRFELEKLDKTKEALQKLFDEVKEL